ncbi:DUF3124 domain-containing protein [Megalodesulfovibrio gigas]|uniref:DUF3124 domain-containing protein n=1 Tax=Megalodesulfovibrio gigas TaxID=879 RepID=UPI000687B7E0|nr:DUF3124 domain-containing protein [Megalodesulfovibrio gigas]
MPSAPCLPYSHRPVRLPACRMLPVLCLAAVLALACIRPATAEPVRKTGALIHVPAYSHIYQGSRNKPFLLTVILAVRNVDPARPVSIESIQYFDGDGKHLEVFDVNKKVLGPLAALEMIIDESDKRGGAGAGFLVRWKADAPVAPPLVETVMISTTGGQGISFVCRGEEVPE